MYNKVTLTIFFILNFLFIETVRGQNDDDSTFRRLFKDISNYYGNVFLDTSYLKADTSLLRKMYPTELNRELELIRIYKMRLTNFNFDNLNQISIRFKTVKEFYDTRKYKIDLSAEDSIVLDKEDSVHSTISKHISNDKVYDSLQRVENLLLLSTFSQIFRDQMGKSVPKHMTLLSVFETEKMYLFIYHFMMLQGYPHYYLKSDLVLK